MFRVFAARQGLFDRRLGGGLERLLRRGAAFERRVRRFAGDVVDRVAGFGGLGLARRAFAFGTLAFGGFGLGFGGFGFGFAFGGFGFGAFTFFSGWFWW